MEKIKEQLELEPDFILENLEEIADIPENISRESLIDEDFKPLEEEPPVEKLLPTEEIASLDTDFKEPLIISDEYQIHQKEQSENPDPKDESDLSSIAAQIDSLTKIDPAPKVATQGNELKQDEKPKKQEVRDEIVVNEEDEIDLDYYSLEEISGEGDLNAKVTDMPEFDAGSSDRQKDSVKRSAAEISPHDRISAEDASVKSTRMSTKPGDSEDSSLTIDIPGNFKDKLSDDFDMQNLGSIDLKEAEDIANEDIVLLTEEDLIEELEEFDLIPLGKKRVMDKVSPTVPGTEKPVIRKETIDKEQKREKEQLGREEAAKISVPESIPESEEELTGLLEESPPKFAEQLPADVITEKAAGTVKRESIIPEIILEDETTTLSGVTEPARVIVPQTKAPEVKSIEKPELIKPEPGAGRPIAADAGKLEIPEEKKTSKIPEEAKKSAPRAVSLVKSLVRETIPAELLRAESSGENVSFIDDDLVEKQDESDETIFRVSELEKITADIVEVIEGKAKVLKEADAADDLDKIAGIMRGTTPAFEDLLIDLEGEYSFKDDEIEYIDHAFAVEDYAKYIGVIDDYSGSGDSKKISTAVEILGLDHDEMGLIENNVFFKEYSGINLDAVRRTPAVGFDQPPSDFNILKKCTYILSRPDSLKAEEKKDIEGDIESGSALLFEEDVDEIRKKLTELRKRRGIIVEEGIADISNEVIIIENEKDVKRFIETMPPEKQESLKKLLRYLDGLFEKLPEDVIKKFADSEYFDIYSKVLSDLGV